MLFSVYSLPPATNFLAQKKLYSLPRSRTLLAGQFWITAFITRAFVGVDPVGELALACGEVLRVRDRAAHRDLLDVAVEIAGIRPERSIVHPACLSDVFLQDAVPR